MKNISRVVAAAGLFLILALLVVGEARIYDDGNQTGMNQINAATFNGTHSFKQQNEVPVDATGANTIVGYTAGDATWTLKSICADEPTGLGGVCGVQTINSNLFLSGGCTAGTCDLDFNETRVNVTIDDVVSPTYQTIAGTINNYQNYSSCTANNAWLYTDGCTPTDGTGDCGAGNFCLGGHEHSSYLTAAITNLVLAGPGLLGGTITSTGTATVNETYVNGSIETYGDENYVLASGESRNVETTNNFSAQYFLGDISFATGASGGLVKLYFNESGDGVPSVIGGDQLLEIPPPQAKQTDTFSGLAAGNYELENYTSELNSPFLTRILAGGWNCDVHASVSSIGTKATRLGCDLYALNATGGDSRYLGRTAYLGTILGTSESHRSYHGIFSDDVVLNQTDRLMVIVFANITGGGSAIDVSLYMAGGTDTSISFGTSADQIAYSNGYGLNLVNRVFSGDNTTLVSHMNATDTYATIAFSGGNASDQDRRIITLEAISHSNAQPGLILLGGNWTTNDSAGGSGDLHINGSIFNDGDYKQGDISGVHLIIDEQNKQVKMSDLTSIDYGNATFGSNSSSNINIDFEGLNPIIQGINTNTIVINTNDAVGSSLKLAHTIDADGQAQMILEPDSDATRTIFLAAKQGTLNLPGLVFQGDAGEQLFLPRTDSTYLLGCVSGDAECAANYRWEKIESLNMCAGDFNFMNDIGMTEASTKYGRDICFVGEKPTEAMAELISLAAFIDFADYQKSHTNDSGEYVGDLTEQEFNTKWALTRKDGQMDFLFGRQCYASVREIKGMMDRQTELIQTLYDNGLITGQQAVHLRDDF